MASHGASKCFDGCSSHIMNGMPAGKSDKPELAMDTKHQRDFIRFWSKLLHDVPNAISCIAFCYFHKIIHANTRRKII